ncbi:MAG: hypothetical protein ABI378_08705 [Chitinophagaceae bacterium]
MNEQGSTMQRKLVSHSAYIFAIRFFPAAAMLAVAIVFSHELPPEIFGVYQQLWVDSAILIALASMGIVPLLLTHDALSINRWLLTLKARQGALFGIWVLLLGVVLIFLLRHYPLFPVPMLFLLLVMQVGLLLCETYLIVNQRMLQAAIISAFYAILFFGIHYLFLLDWFSFSALIWWIVALSLARFLVLLLVSRKIFTLRTLDLRRRNMPVAIRKQWLQLGIYDISQVAFRYIDKFAISLLVGPALFSVYFIGTTDVPFMALMLGAVGNSLLQQMAHGEKTHSSRVKLLYTSGTLLAVVVFPVFFYLFFFRTEFIVFVFSEKYLAAVPLFAISILALPLRAYNYTSLLQHLNLVKIINIGAVLDLGIACGLAVPLYLWKGLMGVAFAFMISSYLQAGFYLFHTSKAVQLPIWKLIPWRQWIAMFVLYGLLGLGLHFLLVHSFGHRLGLFLGAAATAIIIFVSLSPIFFSRKK